MDLNPTNEKAKEDLMKLYLNEASVLVKEKKKWINSLANHLKTEPEKLKPNDYNMILPKKDGNIQMDIELMKIKLEIAKTIGREYILERFKDLVVSVDNLEDAGESFLYNEADDQKESTESNDSEKK